MKLNHVNLTVTDAMETREFLETYFGLRGMSGESVALWLARATGDILQIRGQDVRVEADGDAKFVAELPMDFFPRDVAGSVGIPGFQTTDAPGPQTGNIRGAFELRYRRAIITWVHWGLVFIGWVSHTCLDHTYSKIAI